MKPKREKAEQRARRIGRGLGFYLYPLAEGWWFQNGPRGNEETHPPGSPMVKLWRALERSQRALARERGVRL